MLVVCVVEVLIFFRTEVDISVLDAGSVFG